MNRDKPERKSVRNIIAPNGFKVCKKTTCYSIIAKPRYPGDSLAVSLFMLNPDREVALVIERIQFPAEYINGALLDDETIIVNLVEKHVSVTLGNPESDGCRVTVTIKIDHQKGTYIHRHQTCLSRRFVERSIELLTLNCDERIMRLLTEFIQRVKRPFLNFSHPTAA